MLGAVGGRAAGSLAAWVIGQDTRRLAGYREYLAFYDGAHWAGRPRAGERRLTFNYARIFVRKAVSYMFAEPVNVAVPAASGTRGRRVDARRAEAALRQVYADNDLERVDFDVAVDAAVLGDGAFKVTWDAAARRPVVTPVDVQGLYAWWQPDDYRVLTRVVQTYPRPVGEPGSGGDGMPGSTGRGAGGAPAPPLPGSSTQERVVEDWRPDRYTVEVGGEVVRDGPNPYPWIPYVIFPNEPVAHEFWGASDLIDLMPINQELNRRFSTLAQILDLSGAPIAVLENVEGSEGITVTPGAKWELPQDARAYLLDLLQGGGVELHMKAIEGLYRTLHDVGETPRTAFGDGSRVLSGVALEVELQPLIQKVKRKRAVWNGVYRRRNAMLLDLLARDGQEVGTRRTLAVWGPITPRDRSVLVQDEVSLVAAGVHSRQRASERLGDEDAAAEFAAVLAERRQLAAVEGAAGRRDTADTQDPWDTEEGQGDE